MQVRRYQLLPALLAAAALLLVPAAAAAQTFEVDNLGDSSGGACTAAAGDCTLRDALTLANETLELDTVEFEVAGTIEPETPLPIVSEPVDIDATTVSGYAGAPLVALEAKGEAAAHEALALIGSSQGSSVSGLAIGGFEWGMQLGAPGGNMSVCANYIGVALDGHTATPNGTAILVALGSTGNRIGAGCGALGGNLISASRSYGIFENGTETQISANGIGVDAEGGPLGNGPPLGAAGGIWVTSNSVKPFIGGVPNPGPGESAPNTIANNYGYGVFVETSASNASIRRNSFHGDTLGAIGFGEGGGAGPLEVNNFVAFPGETLVTVFLTGLTPNGTYEVDAYASSQCDANQYGPGEVFLGTGSTTVDASGDGVAEIHGIPLAGIDAESFTAIATDTTTGTTSQFSLCGRTRPEATAFLSKPPTLSSTASPTFTYTAKDFGHIDHYLCSLDGGPSESCATPDELTGLGDGLHKLEVRGVDGEGWADLTPASYEWTVDATGPNVEIESGPAAATNATEATFDFTAEDAGSTVESIGCSIDDGPFEPCISPQTYTGLSLGNHRLEVQATDSLGNTTAVPAAYDWTVYADHTDPVSQIESGPTGLIASAEAEIGFSASDAESGVEGIECRIDAEPFATCATPKTFSGLGDGNHKFEVRAVDRVGNIEATPASRSWTVDTTPPQSSIESGPPAETTATDATFSFSGNDATSGIKALECRLDAAAFEPCSSPQQVSGVGTGQHSFEVRGTDKAGNVESSPATYSWKVNQKPPAEEQKPPPAPENGESVAVAPASGKVYVTRPGGEKVELKEGETIPVGSIVDTTNGKVTLTSVNKAGETQTADFFGGVFVVQQHDGSNLVVLKLRGKVGPCKTNPRRGKGQPRLARAGRKSRHLWGSGHGKFRTEGNYGSASVRGTIWFTEDRCDGTFFKVRRGIVTIRDFTLNKTFALPKGQTYLAQP
ncbi:MAG TPA: hypothetical protein VMT37_09310 [Solirubrobacterales bacterium]|nr:hypothetical protein [Solirubrobacterales bacterium]